MNRTSRLRRLCELRRIEEQNHATFLEEARAVLQQIDEALNHLASRRDAAAQLVRESIRSGELHWRLAGLEEIACAQRTRVVLMSRRQQAEARVRRSLEEYLSKRTERFQAEALLDLALEQEVVAEQRRSQSALDEWHRNVRGRSRESSTLDGSSSGESNA